MKMKSLLAPSLRCFVFLLCAAQQSLLLASAGQSQDEYSYYNLPIPTLQDNLLPNQLSFHRYYQSCPDLEKLINDKVKHWVQKDYTLAPSLLRLHFHDCAATGCDASILLNHEGSERTADASKSLRGFEVIDDIKAEVEKRCPRTVSCADILTAAARDATVLMGGKYWAVAYGRKDTRASFAEDADMVPMGRENVTMLLELFQSRGLNVIDLVVLSGSHTVGRATCGSVHSRLFEYSNGSPSMDAKYVNFLQRRCGQGSGYVDLDGTTPRRFDAQYYANLEKNMGVLYTDQILYQDSRTAPIVATLISQPSIFDSQFAESMARLGNIQVLTAQHQGEIRTQCSFVNSG